MSEELTFEQVLDQELARVRETLIRKRADYGPGNLPKFGAYGVVVRLSDKVERLVNLVQPTVARTPNYESIDDTWLDVAGYAILARMMNAVGPREFEGLPVATRESR